MTFYLPYCVCCVDINNMMSIIPVMMMILSDDTLLTVICDDSIIVDAWYCVIIDGKLLMSSDVLLFH